MARRSNLLPKKTKKVQAGKSVQLISDLRHVGDEPNLKDQLLNEKLLARVFNWYNYMCTRAQVREYIESFLKANKRAAELKMLQQVPDGWLSPTVAWFARLQSRGCILGEVYTARMEQRMCEMFQGAGVVVKREEPKNSDNVISIQDRIREKVSDFIADFEKAIDVEGWTPSMYSWMQQKGIPSSLANKIAEFYKPIADEAKLLTQKQCDPSLKEGYSKYTAAELKLRATFYQNILDDCARHAQNAKTQRAVRKKKAVPADKKLKTFKYQKDCPEFKIVSVEPTKIIGAEQLLIFNTKYKLLTHITALDRAGLDVKGTTITNCDEALSKTYRVARKTEQHLETALRGSKRAVTKMFASLKPAPLQLRINKNTILLKV